MWRQKRGISDVRQLVEALAEEGIQKIQFIDTTDNWLERRIRASAEKYQIEVESFENPLFLNTKEELSPFFRPNKKRLFQTSWYKQQRKDRNILLDEEGEPVGGKWSFDQENRKKYPRKKVPPAIKYPVGDPFWQEAIAYVNQYFPNNPGQLSSSPIYPYTRTQTLQWLQHFFENRFQEFGNYEDAIVAEEAFLHHSVLSPMLNIGLISPQEILDQAIAYAAEHDIPINSLEGFVRQIIGWREFIRGVYESKGVEERNKNYWGFTRSIPAAFYDGTTGIDPVDQSIRHVLKYGYCHHIERLMVLGNFMLLCEFDPNEVYRWFMELFIDAYDWVMVPNVYGMSQFADGGIFATKPYISGSNYLKKMSNYPKGDWQQTWDALFWRFMHLHRSFFLSNPRLGMLVRTFDKMDPAKQHTFLTRAENYLNLLDQKLRSNENH